MASDQGGLPEVSMDGGHERRDLAVGVMAGEVSLSRIETALEGTCSIAARGSTLGRLLDAAPESLDVAVLVGGGELLSRGGPVEVLGDLQPQCAIVMVSWRQEPALIRKALRCGVDGFVFGGAVRHALAPAVSAVSAGYLSVPQAIRQRTDWSAFSVRERQVLQLAAEGLTNSEIGDRLFLSESTVKSHLSTGFRKLGVCSRAEAAAAVLDPDGGLPTGIGVSAPASSERELAGAFA